MVTFCVTETGANDVYQSNSYKIQVLLETEDHYSTWFDFYVDKQSYEITIYEATSDSLMSIEEWRKAQSKKNK